MWTKNIGLFIEFWNIFFLSSVVCDPSFYHAVWVSNWITELQKTLLDLLRLWAKLHAPSLKKSCTRSVVKRRGCYIRFMRARWPVSWASLAGERWRMSFVQSAPFVGKTWSHSVASYSHKFYFRPCFIVQLTKSGAMLTILRFHLWPLTWTFPT